MELAVHHHRNLGVRQHLGGFAAHEDRTHPAPAVRREKDHIAALQFSGLDDLFIGVVAAGV